MTKDEALKLALDALSPDPYRSEWIVALDMDKAITAIKEALAQQEQKPVAWMYKILDYFGRPVWTFKTPKTDIRVFESQPLYTSPPQRKPMTDEQIDEIAKKHIAEGTRSFEVFARAIEAAHGIYAPTERKGEA